ncbi:MAG: ABC transporter substrate-binding protein [Ectothiorhodospiraceae bacterium]|nr:ABC transporter substrate-binding protein [Ectothiorhodospiraceae bacterium]MCH8506194.1 ABC transporter substrate-binding protein [Ectothiorhodospiraceae bacterium]
MMLRGKLMVVLVALALAWPSAGVAADNQQKPDEVIQQVFDESVDALLEHQDEIRESPRVAYDLINEILAPWVHYELMGQLILTSHWREASPEQREAFVEAFSEYVIRTYAALLSDNIDTVAREVSRSGRLMDVQSVTEPDQRNRVLVRTQLRVTDSPVPVHYRMIATDDGWRLWDVVIENISFVTNYRDEFGSEARRNGLDALIERLKERNERAWARQR